MERQWDQVALSRAVLTTYIHTLRSGRAVDGIACVAFADDWKMFYLKRFDLHPVESRGGSCSTAQKARAHPATFCRALLGAYLRYRKLFSLVEALLHGVHVQSVYMHPGSIWPLSLSQKQSCFCTTGLGGLQLTVESCKCVSTCTKSSHSTWLSRLYSVPTGQKQ